MNTERKYHKDRKAQKYAFYRYRVCLMLQKYSRRPHYRRMQDLT